MATAVVTRRDVDLRYRVRQQALRDVVGARLAALLVTILPDPVDQDSIVRYVNAAYPVVYGGQHAVAQNAAGYAQALAAGTTVVPRARRAVDVAGALTSSGVLVTAETRSIVAPALRVMRHVAEGATHAEALVIGGGYAGQLSAGSLQAASRVGIDEGADAAGLEVEAWRSSASGDACDWCQLIAENVYDSPDKVPFHENDKCDVVPELVVSPGRGAYRGRGAT